MKIKAFNKKLNFHRVVVWGPKLITFHGVRMYNDRTEPAITALLNDETPSSIHKLLVQVASIYDVKDLAGAT